MGLYRASTNLWGKPRLFIVAVIFVLKFILFLPILLQSVAAETEATGDKEEDLDDPDSDTNSNVVNEEIVVPKSRSGVNAQSPMGKEITRSC